jgi:hypothetical protein
MIAACGIALLAQAGAGAQFVTQPYGGNSPYTVYSPAFGGPVVLQNGYGYFPQTVLPFGTYNFGPVDNPYGFGGAGPSYFAPQDSYAAPQEYYFSNSAEEAAARAAAVESGQVPATPPMPAVNAAIPRTNDIISATLLTGNRVRMDWAGSPAAVSSILFALLDRNRNQIVGTTITAPPATMTLHRTSRTAYYEVCVTYVNGTTNTVIAPIAAYFPPSTPASTGSSQSGR